jgi:transposase
VTLQVVRDWVLRFNAQGPSGLIDRKAPGNKPLLNPEQRAALAEVVKAGPEPAIDGVVRWRVADLAQWVWETFSISISRHTLGSEMRALGFRKLSARSRHHEQAKRHRRLQKKFLEALAAIAEAKTIDLAEIEIRFGD